MNSTGCIGLGPINHGTIAPTLQEVGTGRVRYSKEGLLQQEFLTTEWRGGQQYFAAKEWRHIEREEKLGPSECDNMVSISRELADKLVGILDKEGFSEECSALCFFVRGAVLVEETK